MHSVNAGDVATQIEQLRRLRREASWWRYGAMGVVLATVAFSLTSLRNSTQALVQPGRAQDEFTAALGAGLQKDVVPSLQDMAGKTLTEMRPQVIAAFQRIQDRAPEFASASTKELNALQADVASRSEKALDATFTQELKSREPKIRQMFPDASEEKIQTFLDNMSTVGAKHITSANDHLFAKHMNAMNGIVTAMTRIQDAEKVSTKGNMPTWELTMSVLDVVRDDLKTVEPPELQAREAQQARAGKTATTSSALKEAVR